MSNDCTGKKHIFKEYKNIVRCSRCGKLGDLKDLPLSLEKEERRNEAMDKLVEQAQELNLGY